MMLAKVFQRPSAIAAILVLVGSSIFLVVNARSSEGDTTTTISAGSGTVPTGGTGTIDITLKAATGVTVAGVDFTVSYDNSVLTAISCTSPTSGICNAHSQANAAQFTWASLSGLNGSKSSITFQA